MKMLLPAFLTVVASASVSYGYLKLAENYYPNNAAVSPAQESIDSGKTIESNIPSEPNNFGKTSESNAPPDPINQTTIKSNEGMTFIIKKEDVSCRFTPEQRGSDWMTHSMTVCEAAGVRVDLTGKKFHYYDDGLCLMGGKKFNWGIYCDAAQDFNMI